MTEARWAYIKALKPPAPRYFHVSCTAYMLDKTDEATGLTTKVPYISKGITFRYPKV